jgi:hypothetical protein
LVSSSSSVPFATFKNTAKADVYRVTLENGTSTLGYTENGNLVIEIPTSDGDFKRSFYGEIKRRVSIFPFLTAKAIKDLFYSKLSKSKKVISENFFYF